MHGICMNINDDVSLIPQVLKPGVSEVILHRYMKAFETTPDNYDGPGYDDLRKAEDACASAGVKLTVMVSDKSFEANVDPCPPYFAAYGLSAPYAGTGGSVGMTAMRWNPYVLDRYLNVLGAIFGSTGGTVGFATAESSTGGMASDGTVIGGYTPEAFRDALIKLLDVASGKISFPRTYWFQNYLEGNNTYLDSVADSIVALNRGTIWMGGPDIIPPGTYTDPQTQNMANSLNKQVYPRYAKYAGKIPLFCSMQNKSMDIGDPLGCVAFARDTLKVKTIFWNRKYWFAAGTQNLLTKIDGCWPFIGMAW